MHEFTGVDVFADVPERATIQVDDVWMDNKR
jgi:hypothetical protein